MHLLDRTAFKMEKNLCCDWSIINLILPETAPSEPSTFLTSRKPFYFSRLKTQKLMHCFR